MQRNEAYLNVERAVTGVDERLGPLPKPTRPSQQALNVMSEAERATALQNYEAEMDAFTTNAMARPAGQLNKDELAAITAGIRRHSAENQ